MRTAKTREFYEKLAEKYGVSARTIEEVDKSQFELLTKMMKSVDKIKGYYPVLRIPYFGIFYIPHSVRRKIDNKYKDKKDEVIGTE